MIAISEDSMKVVIYPATDGSAFEKAEEVVHIKTVQNSAQNCALSNTVTHSENVRKYSIPSHVGILEHVDYHEDSQEDLRESCTKKFLNSKEC